MIGLIDILYTDEQIKQRIKELGEEISQEYRSESLHILCILKGSFIFAADLIREFDFPVKIDFLRISSYGSGTTSGKVKIMDDIPFELEGKHVLIVEDIIDTGNTLSALLNILKKSNPASLKICSLLHKPARKEVEVPIDYLGFEIEDKFVVGYGLDFDERYRNLPFIGIMKG